jgi:fatty-acyl-CoA synthase
VTSLRAEAVSIVPELVLRHASDDDGSEFLRLVFPGDADVVLSYRELVAEASSWAQFYDEAGLAPGDRIVVALPHSVDLYAAYVGAILGAFVPAMFAFPSPKFSEAEYFRTLDALCANAGARMFVTYDQLSVRLKARGLHAAGCQVRNPSDRRGPSASQPRHSPPVDPDAPAFLQYSSGTTGIKKGVAVSHRALLWQLDAYGAAIDLGPDDRVISWLPLYHDMGLIACFFLPLLKKVPVVAMSPFDWVREPALWLQAVTDHRGSLSWLPNFAYSFLAANISGEQLGDQDLATLRGVVNCSEPLLTASHERFLERFAPVGMSADRLAASYALAENTFAVTSGGFGRALMVDSVDRSSFDAFGCAEPIPAGTPGARELVSSGRPLDGVDIEIVDDGGNDVPERTVGEIVVSSPSLMTGYYGNPEATKLALRDGRYRTGDLGYLAGRELFVTGRKGDLIIVGGRNIYPQDIESIVHEVDGVVAGRAVAFGVPRPELGTEGLVVLAETTAEDAEQRDRIGLDVRETVATHADLAPLDVRILPHRTLVKSSAGKPARSENKRRYLEVWQHETTHRATEVDSESELAVVRRIVGEVARQVPANDDERLLSSGLVDSFGLVELLAGIEQSLGVRIPPQLAHEDALDSISSIVGTVRAIRAGSDASTQLSSAPTSSRPVPMTHATATQTRRTRGARSFAYRALFRLKGITCGRGLTVRGRVYLELDGRPSNIVIGSNVTLMPHVHLKNRENGRIVLHDGVKLDTGARLVAANDATIEIGERAVLGPGAVVNAGRDVSIGRDSLTAPYCILNTSDHGIAAGTPIREQPFEHAPIVIGEDVWLGAGVFVAKGSVIGHGAVVSAGSLVSGTIPPGSIADGRPARPIRVRR